MPFNELLKQQREAAGMTQEALAREAGLSLSAVSKLEQKDLDPSWSTVQRLAKALRVSVLVFAEDHQGTSTGTEREVTKEKAPSRLRKRK